MGIHKRAALVGAVNANSSPFLVVHDHANAQHAAELAREFSLTALPVDQLSQRRVEAVPRLMVEIDLTDIDSVESFKRTAGIPPASREWLFCVEQGLARHQCQTQANALGSTQNVTRESVRAILLRRMSIAGTLPLQPEDEAALRAAPGGAAILSAGHELAELFDGLADHSALQIDRVVDTGAVVARSVAATGATAWLDTVRGHHEGTFQHCLLVTGVAASYAARHLKGTRTARRLTEAALLHDIGKALVPLHILDKPGRLNEAEFALVRRHPQAACDYLRGARDIDREVLDAVRHHHEALDGSGYPDGLRGDEISQLTRILTVCDIFAALVEARAYKPPKPPEDAIAILVDMTLAGRTDYHKVRCLAQVFGMELPRTLDEVMANLESQVGHA